MANKIQFEVIRNSDPQFLLLNNTSVYEVSPAYPVWKIVLPSGTEEISVPPPPDTPFQNVTAEDLGIVCEDCTTNPLPDGLYKIILENTQGSIVETSVQYHLRINLFKRKYKDLLLQIEHSEYSVREDQVLKDTCMDLDILVESAQAHAEESNIEKAEELFNKAVKIIDRLIKLLDC